MMQIHHSKGEIQYLKKKEVQEIYQEWEKNNEDVEKVMKKVLEFRPDHAGFYKAGSK